MQSTHRAEAFGSLPDGSTVTQYTLVNETGITVKFLNYGGIIRELWVPDAKGEPANVVLSYDNLEDYLTNPAFIGAVIGRTAGRIRGGSLKIGASLHDLSKNNGANTLHGGIFGFHNRPMAAELREDADALSLILRFRSEDGEGGFPGNVAIEIRYTLMKCENVLTLHLQGISDKKTYLNMTHHSYFNLSGKYSSIEDHCLEIMADAYAGVDAEMLPEAGWTPVEGSVFDMRSPRRIGTVIDSAAEQILRARGIDHPFRLYGTGSRGCNSVCASLHDPESGRTLQVSTSQPHLVVYTGNYLDAAQVASGTEFCRHQGICFEAQEVPDAPGNPHFECTYLEAGERYSHVIRYAFSV